MKNELFGELRVIGMKGCEEFVAQVDAYLRTWRKTNPDETFLVDHSCPRFGTGEAKCVINQTLRRSNRRGRRSPPAPVRARDRPDPGGARRCRPIRAAPR